MSSIVKNFAHKLLHNSNLNIGMKQFYNTTNRYIKYYKIACGAITHTYHHPINIPTDGPQAFLIDRNTENMLHIYWYIITYQKGAIEKCFLCMNYLLFLWL
jgi:hypothetical protein